MLRDLDKTANEVVVEVGVALRFHAMFDPTAITIAFDEGTRALRGRSFNKHVPKDRGIWEVMANPIRTALDSDMQRRYALVAVMRDVTVLYLDSLDLELCEKLAQIEACAE